MTVLLLAWVTGCGPGGSGADLPGGSGAGLPDRSGADLPEAGGPEASQGGPSSSARQGPAGAEGTDASGGSRRSPADGRSAPAPGKERSVEIVLEPGRIGPDGWESAAPTADRLIEPTAIGEAADAAGARRWRAVLPTGPGVARVARAGCGPVEVPYVVGPVAVVVLPYPACDATDALALPGRPGTRLDRTELSWSTIDVLHGLELFVDVPGPGPGEDDGPARWITLAEARAVCAWHGGRLPTRAEWLAAHPLATGTPISNATRDRLGSAPVGSAARALAGVAAADPGTFQDLDGNVEEWLDDGTVAGGSWVSLPGELGVTREVPAEARTDTIGVRCAY